jgi:hypothetical protein
LIPSLSNPATKGSIIDEVRTKSSVTLPATHKKFFHYVLIFLFDTIPCVIYSFSYSKSIGKSLTDSAIVSVIAPLIIQTLQS